MKNLKKLLIIILLSLSSYAYSMEDLQGIVGTLEDDLEELKGKLEDLQERVSTLEESKEAKEEATYEECSADGTECKPVSKERAAAIVARGGRHRRIRRCHGNRCHWVGPAKAHINIQQQFLDLQKKFDIPPLAQIHVVKSRGPQYGLTQSKFNEMRSELNELLAKEILSDADIQAIKTKIKAFASKNPARRPSPEDYQAILDLRK